MAGYPTLTYPDLLENSTREELEQILSLLQGYLSTEHKDDGTHEDITADSIIVSGSATIGEDLTVTDSVTAQADATANELARIIGALNTSRDATGPALVLQGSASANDSMALVCSTAVGGPQLKFVDLASGTLSYIMRLYLAAGGSYTLAPSVAMNAGPGVDLGANASGERFANIYGVNIRAFTALHSPITHLTGTTVASQITANQNDYNPTSLSSTTHLRVSSDAARNITGIAAQTHGRVLMLSNGGGFDITLKVNDAASVAGNRFAIANGADVVVRANNGNVWMRYDTTVTPGFWFVLGA